MFQFTVIFDNPKSFLRWHPPINPHRTSLLGTWGAIFTQKWRKSIVLLGHSDSLGGHEKGQLCTFYAVLRHSLSYFSVLAPLEGPKGCPCSDLRGYFYAERRKSILLICLLYHSDPLGWHDKGQLCTFNRLLRHI